MESLPKYLSKSLKYFVNLHLRYVKTAQADHFLIILRLRLARMNVRERAKTFEGEFWDRHCVTNSLLNDKLIECNHKGCYTPMFSHYYLFYCELMNWFWWIYCNWVASTSYSPWLSIIDAKMHSIWRHWTTQVISAWVLFMIGPSPN